MKSIEPRSCLIVALDLPDAEDALQMVDRLKSSVGFFKIGLQLFTAHGPSIVRQIKESGCGVFLDLKMHDIPNTVGNAVLEAASHGIDMLTLHTLGGLKMMQRAREVLDEISMQEGRPIPQLLGVTILTSMDAVELENVGFDQTIPSLVHQLARLAAQSRMDGLVCSPMELTRLQDEGLRNLFFVTPGIRLAHTSADDQKRITTPEEAISRGARHIVVGRPVIKAPDPLTAAAQILDEIKAGLASRDSRYN